MKETIFRWIRFTLVFIILLFAYSWAESLEADELYVEVGAANFFGNYYINNDDGTQTKSQPVYGTLEVGYEIEGGVSIFARHESSILDNNDQGFNFVGLKYHHGWKL